MMSSVAWLGRLGMDGPGQIRQGEAWLGRHGRVDSVWQGKVSFGLAGMVRPGLVRGVGWGMVRHGRRGV